VSVSDIGLFIGALFIVYFAGLKVGVAVKLIKGIGSSA
jgi:hypothetical protein